MAGHAQLKFVMTECSKTQICLTGLICAYVFITKPVPAQNELVIVLKGAHHKRKNHIVTLLEKREARPATISILPYDPICIVRKLMHLQLEFS